MAEDVGDVIIDLRTRAGLSQRALGAELDLAHSVIGGWERGERPVPRDYLDRLATRYPAYRGRLYVAARALPDHLTTEVEYRVKAALDDRLR